AEDAEPQGLERRALHAALLTAQHPRGTEAALRAGRYPGPQPFEGPRVPYLAPFLVILAVAVFLRMVVPVTVRLTTNVSVRDTSELSRAFDALLVNYMQANYSGDPARLEAPMRGLLAMARELAAQQREPIRDDIVQMMV